MAYTEADGGGNRIPGLDAANSYPEDSIKKTTSSPKDIAESIANLAPEEAINELMQMEDNGLITSGQMEDVLAYLESIPK